MSAYKFLEFDEKDLIKFCDECEDAFLEHESFQRGARHQHSRDKEIMLKLLEANRVLMDKIKEISEDKFVADYSTAFRKLKKDIREALAEADRMMKEI